MLVFMWYMPWCFTLKKYSSLPINCTSKTETHVEDRGGGGGGGEFGGVPASCWFLPLHFLVAKQLFVPTLGNSLP